MWNARVKTEDPSVHCDCREISAARVQIAGNIVLAIGMFAFSWLLWRGETRMAYACHLVACVGVLSGGIAGLYRRKPLFRTLGKVAIALGTAAVLFDLWILFLR